MQNLLKSTINATVNLKEESTKYKEMLDDVLINNENYKVAAEKAKEVIKVRNEARVEVLKSPHAKELNEKLKELKEESKDKRQALSDYAKEYANIANVDEIVADNGETYRIVISAKLVRGGVSE